MARKGGNPELKKFHFNSETAKAAQKKSTESQRKRFSVFSKVRPIIEETAPDSILTDNIVNFWAKHGVEREGITPMLVEITPVYAQAIKDMDFAVLERIYRLLGIAFDSNREHNINVSVGNVDDKPFEINYIVGSDTSGDGH